MRQRLLLARVELGHQSVLEVAHEATELASVLHGVQEGNAFLEPGVDVEHQVEEHEAVLLARFVRVSVQVTGDFGPLVGEKHLHDRRERRADELA